MMLYRCMHKVEAAQWQDTDQSRERFADWFDLQGFVFETRGPVVVLPEEGEVKPGEWIVFSDGEFIAMDDEQFRDTYDEAYAKPDSPARPHIVGGKFQSDKYPMCPAGKVPLSVEDPTAQDLLWEYAQRRRKVDEAFADDLEWALKQAGYRSRVSIDALIDERTAAAHRDATQHRARAALRSAIYTHAPNAEELFDKLDHSGPAYPGTDAFLDTLIDAVRNAEGK